MGRLRQPATTENAADAAGNATIADGLAGTASDSKFVAAAKSVGLDKTLAGPGPYTVLVPSDAAFDKLPAGALDALLKPEAREQLTGVLTYHILPARSLRPTSPRRSITARARRCWRRWAARR